MSGTGKRRGGGPRAWIPPLVHLCRHVTVRLLLLGALLAGLLAMHALSSGHGKHVVAPIASPYSGEHVHGRDHHSAETAGVGAAHDALTGDASTPRPAVLGLSLHEGGPVSALGQAGDAVLTSSLAEPVDPATSHDLCPDWLPGHCPSVLSLAPMCQAVLTGAGLSLLLVLAARGSGWLLTVCGALAQAERRRWRLSPRRPSTLCPSLAELCISRT